MPKYTGLLGDTQSAAGTPVEPASGDLLYIEVSGQSTTA